MMRDARGNKSLYISYSSTHSSLERGVLELVFTRNKLSDRGWTDPQAIAIRPPTSNDGVQVSELIRSCPPLDANSLYCNLLQCTHFADTCALAVAGEHAVGWLSGYRLPAEPETYFVWQVAVAPEARGTGLGIRLLDAVLAREVCRGVSMVLASVALSNVASQRMFARFAARRGARIERQAWLERESHFHGVHESEWALRIGPLEAPAPGRST